MKSWSGIAVVLGFAGVFSSPVRALEQQKEVPFAEGVRPILQKKCFSCHDAGSKKGGLDLSTYESLMGKNVVVPGSPEKSKLYTSVTGASPKMPKNAGPLDKAETEAIANWIRSGAKNPPPARTGLASAEEALKAGKEGTKPVVILFGDTTPKTKLFLQLLSDPSLDQSFMNVAYAAIPYEKDGDEAKKFKVTSAPALLILDPRPEAPKELKKLTSGAPAGVKSAIASAVKTLSAK